jgi:hypothetical protein
VTRFQFLLHVLGFWGCRWFRRWVGGRWEFWLVGSVAGAIWHHNPEHLKNMGRPGDCFGTPVVEDYSLPRARVAS